MNYYNDNDPFAAKWLRCLIHDGLIPDGDVDERPIQDVKAQDLKGYTQCHFFAGIGGWSRAFQIAGWPTDEPVWTGSCPCQPLSIAGKQQGEKDERHLWPEFYRLISQCRPIRIFGEQSESPDGIEWLDGVSLDLEEIGYAVGSVDLPSASVGAPNKRQRAWWVADSSGKRRQQNTGGQSCDEKENGGTGRNFFKPESDYKPSGFGSDNRVANTTNTDGGAGERRTETGTRTDQERGCGSPGHSVDGPMASANGNGCGKARECIGPTGNDGVDGNGDYRLGNSERQGLSVGELQQRSHGKDLEPSQGQGLIKTGFWDQYRIIRGRDGKSRRIPVKSAIFPLAPRIPGRVGLLRGAGNAINPFVAAEFIMAYMEITK